MSAIVLKASGVKPEMLSETGNVGRDLSCLLREFETQLSSGGLADHAALFGTAIRADFSVVSYLSFCYEPQTYGIWRHDTWNNRIARYGYFPGVHLKKQPADGILVAPCPAVSPDNRRVAPLFAPRIEVIRVELAARIVRHPASVDQRARVVTTF